jgi:hypothetical protein
VGCEELLTHLAGTRSQGFYSVILYPEIHIVDAGSFRLFVLVLLFIFEFCVYVSSDEQLTHCFSFGVFLSFG